MAWIPRRGASGCARSTAYEDRRGFVAETYPGKNEFFLDRRNCGEYP